MSPAGLMEDQQDQWRHDDAQTIEAVHVEPVAQLGPNLLVPGRLALVGARDQEIDACVIERAAAHDLV